MNKNSETTIKIHVMSTENKLKKSPETKNINQILKFMKKIFMALVLCLVSICGYGQKTFSSNNFIVETVDEFGDKTGNIKVGIIAKGYFSNSATTNSCAELIISFMKNSAWSSLYEYCRNHPSDDNFYIIATGTTTNDTIILHSSQIEYSFIELCENNDTIKITMIEDSKYSSTVALFKLYDCKDFYSKYISEFGESNYFNHNNGKDGVKYLFHHLLKNAH